MDLLLIVVESYVKSIVTAARTRALAAELGVPRVALVGNRVGPEDLDDITALADSHALEIVATIPEDPAVRKADQVGRCVLDLAPGSDAIRALEELADALEQRLMSGEQGSDVGKRLVYP
ncbi:MAG: hypothetical protein ABR575_10250 [Actinomycetota bacterium]